jgi:hypothetical protein
LDRGTERKGGESGDSGLGGGTGSRKRRANIRISNRSEQRWCSTGGHGRFGVWNAESSVGRESRWSGVRVANKGDWMRTYITSLLGGSESYSERIGADAEEE